MAAYRKIRPLSPQICFCHNQSVHQIYHSLFIAVELSNIQDKFEVIVFSTSYDSTAIIEKELSCIANKVKLVKIYHLDYWKKSFSLNWFAFLCRLRMDRPKAVIVTDYFDNVFRQLGVNTFWVYTGHGGKSHEYGYNEHIKDYDMVIVPGERIYKQIKKRIGRVDNCFKLGYSKFDYFYYHKKEEFNLFDNPRPTILYNPHFKKELSSFFDAGEQLLESLSRTDKYNIIFMPHPCLERQIARQIDNFKLLKNVVVADSKEINLSYMIISDLYITDISSSIFEWLYFRKPAIIFNAKKVKWRGNDNYTAWQCAKVVENIADILKTIDHCLVNPDEFKHKREEMFKETFSNNSHNVSGSIAETIFKKLRKYREIKCNE